MNIEELREYCLAKKMVSESFPFDETTLVFKVMNRMFAITDLGDDFSVVIKTDPEKYHGLLEQYHAVRQPRYFRGSWVQVMIDGSIDEEVIKEWIDESYILIVKKLPLKVRKELEEM